MASAGRDGAMRLFGLRAVLPVVAALGLCLGATAARSQVRGSDLLTWCQGALSTAPTALSDAFQCTIYLQAIVDQPRAAPADFERCLGKAQPSGTDLMAGILPTLEELSGSDPAALSRNANEIVADWIAERCATEVAAGQPDVAEPDDTAATDGTPAESDVATTTPDEPVTDVTTTDTGEEPDIVPPDDTAATDREPAEPDVAVVTPERPEPEPDVAVVTPEPPVAPADPGITECDRLAAMPFDPAAVAPGVETPAIDAAAATEACEKAAAEYTEIARFRLQLGRALDRAGKPEEAVALYRPMAEGGYAAAQALMGTLYQTGRGVPEDLGEAVRWHRLAADQGNVVAQTFIAVAYAVGDSGFPQDGEAAARLLQDAAARGYTLGQVALGALYADGNGVPKDEAQAAIWFARAIAGGDAATAPGWLRQLPRAARVRGAQRLLTELGYDAGPEDGQAGGKTRAAVEAFQAAQGLAATGAIDDDLLVALARAERG